MMMEKGTTENFLPIMPSQARHGFDVPRSVQTSSTGIPYSRSGGVGFWRGSFRLPRLTPKIDAASGLDADILSRPSGREVICFFAERNNNSGFFFADLTTLNKKDTDDIPYNLEPPEWWSIKSVAGEDLKRTVLLVRRSIWEGTTDDIDPGDIISFRETGGDDRLADHVTARCVVKKTPKGAFYELTLNHPLPQEFLDDTVGISKQICFNRPHCRAVITSQSGLWQVEHRYATIPTLSWVEDSIKPATAYKDIRVFQLENDNLFQLENDKYLQL